MAVLHQSESYSLADLAKGHDPQGKVAPIIETLWEHGQGDLIKDLKFMLANDKTRHEFQQQLTEAVGTWTGIDVGIPNEAVKTKNVVEDIFMLQSRSKVDTRLLKKADDPEAFLAARNKLHLKGMEKNVVRYIFYGRSGYTDSVLAKTYAVSEEKAPKGLAARYNDISDFPNSIINGGGSGVDLASVWVIKHGPNGLFLCIPKDGQDFVKEDLKGPRDTLDASSNAYEVIVTEYTIQFGICIADPKAIQRICNLEVSGTSNIFDEDYIIDAIGNMQDTDGAVIYMPPKIYTAAVKLAKDKTNVNFTEDNAFGKGKILNICGLPVRNIGGLNHTETAVPA